MCCPWRKDCCKCNWAIWSTFAEIHSTLWNFRLEFVTRTSQQTRELPNLSYDRDLWIHLVFRLLLVLFQLVGLSVEVKDDWTFSHCFHRSSFCSHVDVYIHGIRYLHNEVHELDGYNNEFWKSSVYSLKCVLELSRLNFTRESAFKGTPLNWDLTIIFKDLYFMSHYWAANRIKHSVVRSTNIVI